MLRIAHVSDLHLQAAEVRATPTPLQRALSFLGLEINAQPYDAERLKALRLALRRIRPSLLVVSGDLTNFGDEPSMAYARQEVDRLREAAAATNVVVVPGNHDTFTERAAAIERETSWPAAVARQARFINREAATARRLASGLLPASAVNAGYLNAYTQLFGGADPSEPKRVELGWGPLAIFPFNSNMDDRFQANAGRVGKFGLNALEQGLQDHSWALDGAMRMAILHHHPISAPQAADGAPERFFNWMEDGTRFLQSLNHRHFSFVLHGHQHYPFVCSIDYGWADGAPLHIIAAGSATQPDERQPNSFNVIEIRNPFEIRVERYNYDGGDGGFVAENRPRHLAIRSLEDVRLTAKGEPEIAEDGAVRNLLLPSDDAYDFDCEYDELDYKVTITDAQRYIADYRRTGRVVNPDGCYGPVFVITGSPRMKIGDMKLSATSPSRAATPEVIDDHPTRKVVRVIASPVAMKSGDPFDVTLHFEWQADAEEPNDFDGFNLLQMTHGVKRFAYKVNYPWKARKVIVKRVLWDKGVVIGAHSKVVDKGVGQELTLQLENPVPGAYLVFFGPDGPEKRQQAWER